MFDIITKRFKSFYKLNYLITLAAVWTISITSFLVYDLRKIDQEVFNNARAYAEVGFNKDVTYRRWNAMHGGVYVPVTERTPPNPNLSNIPDRDITHPSGEVLTLMNPAYMTRQIFELEEEEEGIRGHLTSLNPVRPENKPDAWEKTALEAFEIGVKEVVSIEDYQGGKYLRVMKPFMTEEGCLRCHAIHGYNLNDIRGGISVSIPFENMLDLSQHNKTYHVIVFALLWILGLVALTIAYGRIRIHESKRIEAEKALELAYADLEIKVEQRTQKLSEISQKREELEQIINKSDSIVFLWKATEGRPVEYVSNNISLFGYSPDEFYANEISYADIIHLDDIERVRKEILTHIETDAGEFTQAYRVITKSGNILFIEDLTWIRRDEKGEVTHFQGLVTDVTERAKAEESQKESEEKYRALYHNAPLAYQSLDADGCFLDVNPTWLKTLGYDWDEVIGKNYADYLHSDWKPHFEKNFSAFKKSGTLIGVEFRIRHKDGHYIDVSFEGCVGYHPDGSFKQTYCVFQDISDRKKLNEALINSESKFKTLFHGLNDAAFVHSIGNGNMGRFLEVNEIACKRLGYSRDELLKLSPDDIDAPNENRPVDLEVIMKNLQDHGTVSFETTHRSKDGQDIPVEINTSMIEIDGQTVFLSLARDISDRKLAEAALRESEEKYRLFFENSDVIALFLNPDTGVINFVNQAAVNFYGYPSEKLLGMNIDKINQLPPEEIKKKLKDAKQKKQGYYIFQHKLANGSIKDVEIYQTKLILKGETTFSLLIHDITEKLAAEKELINQNRELQIFNDATVGRELKIVDLKKEINAILKKAGKKPKYEIPV